MPAADLEDLVAGLHVEPVDGAAKTLAHPASRASSSERRPPVSRR